ncbi:hypothetical protein HRbin39_00188 [bacterium HR39]|nr:hypothetical protein HRbin39_00188 [bacterium HR39]
MAVEGQIGHETAPAQDAPGAVDQRPQQLPLEPPVDGPEQPGHLGAALQHLGRRHARPVQRPQPVHQQRVADGGAQVREHQLRDVEASGCLQRREAGRARRLGDDAAGREVDVGRVEHAVVVGEPDAGHRDGGVLEDELHHAVGGADVGQRRHHRRAAVDLARRLEPAEGEKGRAGEAALSQHEGSRQTAGAGRQEGEEAAVATGLHHRLDELHPAARLLLEGAGELRRQAGFGKAPAQAREGGEGAAELAGDASVAVAQHEHLGERHGGEAQRRRSAQRRLAHQQGGGAGGHEVQKALVELDVELRAGEVGLEGAGRPLQFRCEDGAAGVVHVVAGDDLEPARPGRRQLGEQAGGELRHRVPGGAIVEIVGRARGRAAVEAAGAQRCGVGEAFAPEGFPRAAPFARLAIGLFHLERGRRGHARSPSGTLGR